VGAAVAAAGAQLANTMAAITTKNNTKRLDIFSSLEIIERINQQIIVAVYF
jgi:hypothetical protein